MTSSRAPSFDLFKLIVALILLSIFLFLLFWRRPSQARQPDDLVSSSPTSPPTADSATTVSSASTSSPLTATQEQAPSQTPTTVPSPTETPEPTPTAVSTESPAPTETPVPESTPTSSVESLKESSVCEAISPSQIQRGMRATIKHYLNFRSSPGISNNWILTNAPGTQVDVVAGPECTRQEGGGTYLWWQIELPDGQIGWSAEASASGAFYFMEPTQ
jgi:hypothetical protein